MSASEELEIKIIIDGREIEAEDEPEVCPVCGELDGKHGHGLTDGDWIEAYPD